MADRANDISAIRSLEVSWCDAWNSHDMRALANLLTRDVDFVTVGGRWLRGRQEFMKYTTLLHATMFKHSTFDVRGTTIKFVGPGIAIAHVTWKLQGDFDPDGTPRKPRTGIFSQFLVKSRGRWRILASQNTNKSPLSSRRRQIILGRRDWK